jgi:uncharacterized RmlC-like cupin family protein
MLAPPNRGSELVDTYGDLALFEFLAGRTGRQLGTGTDSIPDNLGAATWVHHHGALESVILVIRGKARMRWGLEYVAETGPGDFIFVPP